MRISDEYINFILHLPDAFIKCLPSFAADLQDARAEIALLKRDQLALVQLIEDLKK